jgi:cephalosporin hydroxylase
VALQELIWSIRPDLIIETGVAHGGSVVFSASLLELLGGNGRVIGIEVALRPANRAAIEQHPMSKRIMLVDGCSVDSSVIAQVTAVASTYERVMVILDSSHTEEHVLAELRAYSPLVSAGSYIVVMDTAIEELSPDWFGDRPWSVGNNPMTAVRKFLEQTDRFVLDADLVNKLAITGTPAGYLRCVRSAK